MNQKNLWSIRWTQPYSSAKERPYLRMLHEQLEALIEQELESGNFAQANIVINRIKNVGK